MCSTFPGYNTPLPPSPWTQAWAGQPEQQVRYLVVGKISQSPCVLQTPVPLPVCRVTLHEGLEVPDGALKVEQGLGGRATKKTRKQQGSNQENKAATKQRCQRVEVLACWCWRCVCVGGGGGGTSTRNGWGGCSRARGPLHSCMAHCAWTQNHCATRATVTTHRPHHVALGSLGGGVAVRGVLVQGRGAVSDGGTVQAQTEGGTGTIVVQGRHVTVGGALEGTT